MEVVSSGDRAAQADEVLLVLRKRDGRGRVLESIGRLDKLSLASWRPFQRSMNSTSVSGGYNDFNTESQRATSSMETQVLSSFPPL